MKSLMINLGIILLFCEALAMSSRVSLGMKKNTSPTLSQETKEETPSLERNQKEFNQKSQLLNIELKWMHEEIGGAGFLSSPSHIGGGILTVGHGRRLGPKISKEGILYIDAISNNGPKLHAIDVNSGEILKSKDMEPGYYLLGISRKAIYLAPYDNIPRPAFLLALDRNNWTLLWKKDRISGRRILDDFCAFYLTEEGILYSEGFLDDDTGQLRTFPEFKNKDTVEFIGRNIVLYRSAVTINGEDYIITALDVPTRKVLWEKEGRILGQSETNDLFFFKDSCINCVDRNTGEVKWESEKLSHTSMKRFVGATEKVLIFYGEVLQGNIPLTLWYGIDSTSGKILWKKWAKQAYEKSEPKNPFYMRDYGWSKMVGETLVIGKSDRLVLVDSLNGEIAQEKEFSRISDSVVYKDILIVLGHGGLKAYQLKK